MAIYVEKYEQAVLNAENHYFELCMSQARDLNLVLTAQRAVTTAMREVSQSIGKESYAEACANLDKANQSLTDLLESLVKKTS
jgi:hypothetical protein